MLVVIVKKNLDSHGGYFIGKTTNIILSQGEYDMDEMIDSQFLEGPSITTCGNFGHEGAVVLLITSFIISVVLIKILLKSNKVIQPSWKRA